MTVVGPRAVLDDVAEQLGHVSSHDIVEDRHDLDFRRVTLSNKPLVGHTVGELDLERSSGRPSAGSAAVTSTSSPTTPSCSRWATGCGSSRLATRWPRSASTSVTATAACPTSTSAGSRSGSRSAWRSGLIHVPTPGGGFTVGAAAGTLVVGLVFGRLGRVGPGHHLDVARGCAVAVVPGHGHLPRLRRGQRRAHDHRGARLGAPGGASLVLGLVLTASAAALLVLGVHVLRRMSWLETAGALAGSPDPAGDPRLRQRQDRATTPGWASRTRWSTRSR